MTTLEPVQFRRTIVSVVLLTFLSVEIAFAADDMKAFPDTEEGMSRHVILPVIPVDERAAEVRAIKVG